MATPSNLYAEKAFSEHPIALWALDDQLDYVSLISETQRVIAEYVPERTNLVNNPSFEDTTSGWYTDNSTLARSTSHSKFGSYSLLVTPSTSNGGAMWSASVTTTGVQYILSAWIYAESPTTVAFTYGGASESIPANTWTRISHVVTFSVPTNFPSIRSVGSTTPFYVDAVMVERGNILRDYFDGSFAGAYWFGTANFSKSIMAEVPGEWTIDGATVAVEEATVSSPFVDSVTNKVTSSATSVELTSPILFNSDDISSDLASVSFSINLLDQDGDVELVELGYSDGTTEYVTEFLVTEEDVWKNLVATFPSIAADKDVSLFVRVTLATGSTPSVFFINGISVGQWSENFCSTSLGLDLEPLPSDISLSLSMGVPSAAYASENNVGYYLAQNGALRSRNSSIPMVYGASNSTIIRPGTGPGLIIPGKGFMNASGKSSTMTFEAWLRINSNAASARIIGPIASTDGLYVDGPFLVLKVGDKTCSHFVGEWFKPMLVDISISSTSASIMINGERVSSMDLSKSLVVYADPEDAIGRSQDWIGFYVPENVFSVEVDCVGIYPYEVTEILAKKRFVSGQGVAYPQDVNVAYSGESIFIDYSFANYAKNYDYPEIVSWQQGVSENMDVSPNRLASPAHNLPKLASSSTSLTLQKLISDTTGQIKMRPTADWDGYSSYLYFDNLNILQTPVFGVYGVFKKETTDSSTNRQTLIKILNKTSGSYLAVYLEDTELSYVYKAPQAEELVLDYDETNPTATITKGTSFAAGFSIQKLISVYPQLSQFFSNRSNLSVFIMGDYVGTDESISTMFPGLLYSFGMMTNKNIQEFLSVINVNGIIEITNSAISGASYELNYTSVATVDKLEIKTKSYWDSQVPLSALAKSSYNSDGTRNDALDFIQISLDYPQTRDSVTNELDLSSDLTQVFVTFQSISSGANTPSTEFTDAAQTASEILVVEPGVGWEDKKYRVIDGSIIYPPNTNIFELAICIHVEMVAPASLSNKLQNRYIRLSSQSLSDNSSVATSPINSIGTRFGKSVYPYTENTTSGFPLNVSFKERNPFKIFRGAGPHLYLTNNSGITMSGEYDSDVDRGLYTRLNKEASPNSNISSMQMAVLWNNKLFPETAQKIFEIVSGTGVLRFYVQAVTEDGKRGRVFAKLVSGGVDTDTDTVLFFLNGSPVGNPVLTIGQWGMLGIVFKPYLVFNNAVGYLKITSPILLNNISTYQLTGSDQLQQIVYRTWEDVLNNEEGTWDEWYNGTTIQQTWSDMLYQVATFNPAIDPAEIYKVYIGTNKIIADSSADSGTLMYNNYQYAVYENVQRDAITATQL